MVRDVLPAASSCDQRNYSFRYLHTGRTTVCWRILDCNAVKISRKEQGDQRLHTVDRAQHGEHLPMYTTPPCHRLNRAVFHTHTKRTKKKAHVLCLYFLSLSSSCHPLGFISDKLSFCFLFLSALPPLPYERAFCSSSDQDRSSPSTVQFKNLPRLYGGGVFLQGLWSQVWAL